MGNLSALLFTCISYLVPLLSPGLRRNSSALWIAWASLTFHHLVALINAFVTPILASWGDIYRFHNIAAGISDEPQNFGMLLRVVYKTFGTSFWLGEETSILAFSFCLVLIAEIARQLKSEASLAVCIGFFSLLPSPLIHTSVILREPIQMLGFLGTVHSLFSLRESAKPTTALALAASLFTLIFMHQGLVVFVAAVLALVLPWSLQNLQKSDRGNLQALIILAALLLTPLLLPKLIQRMESESHVAHAISHGKLLEYTEMYRAEVNEARSDYGVQIETDSIVSFTASTLLCVLMFFIAPLPWQASSALDYYAFGEVCLRIVLFYGAYRTISQSSGETRQRMVCLFLLSMGLDCLWALGTTNWGTSLRHHIVSYGGFVLLGTPYLGQFALDPQLAALSRRREANRRLGGRALSPSQPFEVRNLLLVVRKNAAAFLAMTATLGGLIAWTTWPNKSQGQNSNSQPYVSRASLLLPSATRFSMTAIFASTGQSDLDFWLSNEALFDKMMASYKVYLKLENLLARTAPHLVSQAATVQVLPVRLFFYEKTLDTKNEIINPFLAGLNSASQGTTVERDYAQIYQDEMKALGRFRVSRIVIQAGAQNPEDARILASGMASVLQKVLVQIAVRKSQSRRKMVEQYLKIGALKILRSQRKAKRSKGLDPAVLAEQLQQRQSLEAQCRRLKQETNSLKIQIENKGISTGESPLASQVEKLRHDYRQAALLFLPSSRTLRQLEQKLNSLQKLLALDLDRRKSALQAPLIATLETKQRLLDEYQSRLARLLSRMPSAKAQQSAAQIYREVEAWETEQLQWEEQLLQARIEERLCQGDGTAVLLQTPSPGIRVWTTPQAWSKRYARTLKFLPLAPLLSALFLALVHFGRNARRIAARVESMLDVPILGDLPIGA